MKIKSQAKYVRVAPSKAMPLARKLRGVSLTKALQVTRFSRLKAAAVISEVLKTAVADLNNNHKCAPDDFRVAEVIVEPGPAIKRYWSRSRGMVRPIRRRTSHISVVLDDGRKVD